MNLENLKKAKAKAGSYLTLTRESILVAVVELSRAPSKEFLSRISKISLKIL